MTEVRFLQIHTLHSYSSVLLNRDDSGFAKRLPFGGTLRTRISSQCLKRHWRKADDVHALSHVNGFTDAFRSRELVTEKVIGVLPGSISPATRAVVETLFQTAVYGDKGTDKSKRQTLLFGKPEMDWLAGQARDLAERIDPLMGSVQSAPAVADDAKGGKKARKPDSAPPEVEKIKKEWADTFKANIRTLREQTTGAAGLAAALFGRMVTSDPAANIDAPIHVAHAFTTHAAETESDYLTAMDDLKRDDDDSGADTIQETELTSGLFYGYVVVDVPALVSNTAGCQRKDWLTVPPERRALAAEVIHNLLYLIAEVSPGAKLGSTAPYGRAELMLVEAGNRQPRSLSAAFREPSKASIRDALHKLEQQLGQFDKAYATGEARRALHLQNTDWGGVPRGSISDLAQWAKAAVASGDAA
ncbi:MAG: type I-E CRISPR-associated protein Cas7/Cse4/CasC [Hyphomicrobiaceae bacterium]